MDRGYPEDGKRRNRHCEGICGVWQNEGDPEPEIVIARVKTVS